MESLRRAFVMGLILLAQLGCAVLERRSGDHYRDGALSQLNPAPVSMSPPVVADSNSPQIDPVYLQSQADYHFTMGESLSLDGKPQKAIEAFKLTLVYDPKATHVHLKLAAEYMRMGLLNEALEHVEEALALDPNNTSALMLAGGIYSGLKMYDLALVQYQKVSTVDPDHLKAPIYIGAILAEQKKFDAAVKVFERLAANPKNEEPEIAYFYQAKVRDEEGTIASRKQAESYYKKAIALRPSFVDPVLGLAALYIEVEKNKEGQRVLESYQEKFGPRKEVAQILSQLYLQEENFDKAYEQLDVIDSLEAGNLNVKIQMALILIEKTRFPEAVNRLEDILRLEPELDKVRFYLAAVHEEMGSSQKAIDDYLRITPSSAYYPDAIIHAANLYRKQSDFKKASEVITEAIKLREDIHQFYSFYASLLDDQKEYQKAVAMLKGAVGKFADNVQLTFFLGTMQDRVGNTEESIAQMNRVLELDSEHVQAMNYLAYTYAELSTELEKAQVLAKKALALKPDDGYVLDTVGWVYFKSGNFVEAIKFLELAHKKQADEAIIAEHLGDAYFRHQMVDKALRMYNKAVGLESDSRKALKIRDKITFIEKKMADRMRTPASVVGP